jgi:hypothetical protein
MLKHSLLEYVLTHNQPFVGILIGAALLAFVAFMNWYGDIKANTVGWLAKRFYRNSYQSDKAANDLFMVITSLFLIWGFLCIIVACYFLGNATV